MRSWQRLHEAMASIQLPQTGYRWSGFRLAPNRTPIGGGEGQEDVSSGLIGHSGMKHDRQVRQLRQAEYSADIDGTERQHARRESGDAQAGHHRRGNRGDPAANEHFVTCDASVSTSNMAKTGPPRARSETRAFTPAVVKK